MDYYKKYLKYKTKYSLFKNKHNMLGGNLLQFGGNDEPYNVSIVKKDGSLSNVGMIKPCGEYIINIPANLETLKKSNCKIFKIIDFYDEFFPFMDVPFDYLVGNVQHGNESINFQVFGRDRYRKGAIYYILQESNRGIRFLVYVSHKIFHQSIAFGEELAVPDVKTLITNFKNIIEKYDGVLISDKIKEVYKNDNLYLLD